MITNWRTGSPYSQLRSYTVWSMVFVLVLAPLLVWTAFSGTNWSPIDFLFFALLLIQCVVAGFVGRDMIQLGIQGTRPQLWPIAAVAVLTIATAALVPSVSGPSADPGLLGWAFLMMVVLAVPIIAISPGVTIYASALASVIGAAIVGATWAVGAARVEDPAPYGWINAGVGAFVAYIVLAGSFRVTIWQLMRVREQEESASVRADLAVAEERLRFSRDLHDIFGRTLTAVVLKSDLAAELAEAGHTQRAAAEMREVQQLSDEALREVRAVVAGYRQVNLPTEIAGAKAVLEAAGVRSRLIGDPASIPPTHAEPLAWAVREGVTNVLRHATAATCTIDVHLTDAGGSVLTITNDGVPSPPVNPVPDGEPSPSAALLPDEGHSPSIGSVPAGVSSPSAALLPDGGGSPPVQVLPDGGGSPPVDADCVPYASDDTSPTPSATPTPATLTRVGGSGLAGVSDRLRPLGGTVTHKSVNGTFTLRIEIPREVR
nr:hypothetical protein [Actinomycetales bacterium]